MRPHCRAASREALLWFWGAQAGSLLGVPHSLLQALPMHSPPPAWFSFTPSQCFAAAVIPQAASCSCVSRTGCPSGAWRDSGSLLGLCAGLPGTQLSQAPPLRVPGSALHLSGVVGFSTESLLGLESHLPLTGPDLPVVVVYNGVPPRPPSAGLGGLAGGSQPFFKKDFIRLFI